MKVLHKFTVNWADETDFDGFEIVDMEDWENRKKVFDAINEEEFECNINLGSNEDVDYYKGELREYVEIGRNSTIISDEEADVIDKYFGSDNGPNLWIDFVESALNDRRYDSINEEAIAAVEELYSEECCDNDEDDEYDE